MPNVKANGIQIEYDTFGSPADEPLLLIMGLGSQMVLWHEDFCRMLAERGHYVIRFDNRDVGLSTKFDAAGVPDIVRILTAALQGQSVEVPYTLDDMADDAVGLLDAIGIGRAHVCGASMGGMIAQAIAIRHPQRVKSLVSIMSTTGDPTLPPAKPEVLSFLLTPAPTERGAFVDHSVRLWRAIGSPGFPFDEDFIRARSGMVYDRCFCPAGQVRQLAAILGHGSRRERLKSVQAPTLVIHGLDDPLVPVEGGKDTAAHIAGAELLLIEGMGHDNPRPVWPRAIDAIARLTRRAARAEAERGAVPIAS
jgi:pimeloyl-ACP methyl ester carboxylesterase